MEFITPARRINPRDQRTLARLAGVLLLDDGVPDRAGLETIFGREPSPTDANAAEAAELSRFETIWRTVLADHPRPGVFLNDLGDILDGHRKYDAAEVCYRRAIEVMRREPVTPFAAEMRLFDVLFADTRGVRTPKQTSSS